MENDDADEADGKNMAQREADPMDDAKIHVLSHVVSYASAVFEGLRCYETKNGPAIFRVREHMQRMVNSGKIYRLELPYSAEDFPAPPRKSCA